MSDIRTLLKQIVKADDFEEMYAVPCTVKAGSINMTDLTCVCSPINGDADFIDVRLQADPGDGVVMIPAEGSTVMVQPINNMTGFIAMFSRIESIKFLDGTFGGLVKVIDLTAKLNAIEQKVNALISFINTHSHASNGAPPSPTFTGGNLTETQRADIENTKITHGDN